jgi:hypothetical protein
MEYAFWKNILLYSHQEYHKLESMSYYINKEYNDNVNDKNNNNNTTFEDGILVFI